MPTTNKARQGNIKLLFKKERISILSVFGFFRTKKDLELTTCNTSLYFFLMKRATMAEVTIPDPKAPKAA